MNLDLRGPVTVQEGETVVLLTPIVERLGNLHRTQVKELAKLRKESGRLRELPKKAQFLRDGIRQVAQKESEVARAAVISARELGEFHEAITLMRFDVQSLETQLQAVLSREAQLKELYAVKRLRHAEEAEQREHEDAFSKRREVLALEASTAISLRVTIIQASVLQKGSIGGGLNPFCICKVFNREDLQFQTEVAVSSKTPFWNRVYGFAEYPRGSSLEFALWNQTSTRDDFLGKASLAFERFFPSGFSGRLPLEKTGMTKKEKKGHVDVTIKNLGLITNPSRRIFRARVTIISVQDLQELDAGSGLYCLCEVVGEEGKRFETHVLDCTQAFVWNYTNEFDDFSFADALKITVWSRSESGDHCLGRAVVMGSEVSPYSFTGDVILDDAGDRAGANLSIHIEFVDGGSSSITSGERVQETVAIKSGSLLISASRVGDNNESVHVFESESLGETLRDIQIGDIVVAAGPSSMENPHRLPIVPIEPMGFVRLDSFAALPRMEHRTRIINFAEASDRIRNGTVLVCIPPVDDDYRHADIFQEAGSEKGVGVVAENATVVVSGPPILDHACVMVPIRPHGFVQLSLFEVVHGIENRKSIEDMTSALALIKHGVVLVCIMKSVGEARYANVFDDLSLQGVRRIIPEGCTVMAAGVPVLHGENIMLPIDPRGFVNLEYFDVVVGLEDTFLREHGETSMPTRDVDKQNSPQKSAPPLQIIRPAVLSIVIVKAKGLHKADATGASDPYCLCELVGQGDLAYKTQTVRNNQNPVWNHVKELGYLPGDRIRFSVYDQDETGDDLLGRKTISHSKFYPNGFEGTIFLDDAGHKNVTLTIIIDVLSTETKMPPPRPLSAVLPVAIKVTVLRARNLQIVATVGGCDPYCVCEVLEMPCVKFKTTILKSTTSPEWNHVHEFMHYLPGAGLLFSVYSQPSIYLGRAILDDARFITESFEGGLPLSGIGKDGMSTLEVRVEVTSRTLQKPDTEPPSLQSRLAEGHSHSSQTFRNADEHELVESAHIRVTIIGARGLRRADISSRASPYCTCEFSATGSLAFKTRVLSDTQAPFWNHAHDIVDYVPGQSLKFSVWTQDLRGDDLLGVCNLDFKGFFPKGFDGEIELDEPGEGNKAALILTVEVLDIVQTQDKKASFELSDSVSPSRDLPTRNRIIPSRMIRKNQSATSRPVGFAANSNRPQSKRLAREPADGNTKQLKLANWDLDVESDAEAADADKGRLRTPHHPLPVHLQGQQALVVGKPLMQSPRARDATQTPCTETLLSVPPTPQPQDMPMFETGSAWSQQPTPRDNHSVLLHEGSAIGASSMNIDAEFWQAGLRQHGADLVGSKAQVCNLLHTKLNAVKEEHDATVRAMSERLDEERRLRLALQARLEQAKQKAPTKVEPAAGDGSEEDPWASSSDESDPGLKGVEFRDADLPSEVQLLADAADRSPSPPVRQPSPASSSSSRDL